MFRSGKLPFDKLATTYNRSLGLLTYLQNKLPIEYYNLTILIEIALNVIGMGWVLVPDNLKSGSHVISFQPVEMYRKILNFNHLSEDRENGTWTTLSYFKKTSDTERHLGISGTTKWVVFKATKA